MKPEPIITETICSLCGLPWEDHGDKPTKDDCIRLLRDELARRPVQTWTTIQGSDTFIPLHNTGTFSNVA